MRPSLRRTTIVFALFLLTAALALPGSIGPAECAESAVVGKLEEFTDSIIADLLKRMPVAMPVAIADFDEQDERSRQSDLGFAVSEIMTDRFAKSGKFVLVEKKQLEKVVRTLELGQTGLYNSDKVAALGWLVGARYLVVGSVSHLAGFYRVSARVVEVQTGAVLLSDSVEIDTQMLEDAADKYQPPRYRVTIGSTMNWYGYDSNNNALYTLGLSAGWWYQLFRNQWVSLVANYHFDYFFEEKGAVIGVDNVYISHEINNALVAMAGYGYRFGLTRVLSIQPGLFAGWVAGTLKTNNNFNGAVDISSETYSSGIFQPRIDLIFLEQSPLSFYANIGYFYHLEELSESFQGLTLDRTIQGVKIEGGVMIYL